MTSLQVLLVGPGGSGTAPNDSSGYGAGGGEVKIVDFSEHTSTPLLIHVGTRFFSSVNLESEGAITARAGYLPTDMPGQSGNGYQGFYTPGGGGGGAGGPATVDAAGPGVTPASIALPGSPFLGDDTCYGGGGIGYGTIGVLGGICGGGHIEVIDSIQTLIAPTPNSGSGGGSLGGSPENLARGADGIVVIRWFAPALRTVTFDSAGHGTAVQSVTVLDGDAVQRPADPIAEGFAFEGWYTNADLATAADFSAPLSESVIYFASWRAVVTVIAATGPQASPLMAPLGGAALLGGITLLCVTRRTTRARLR